MTFSEFLAYLEGPGIQVAFGILWSFLVERYPKWANMPSRDKRLLTLVLCMAIPLLATAVGVASGYQQNNWDLVWWPSVVAGFVAFAASTATHTRKMLSR